MVVIYLQTIKQMKYILIGGHRGISNGSTRSLLNLSNELANGGNQVELYTDASFKDFFIIKSDNVIIKKPFPELRRSFISFTNCSVAVIRLFFILFYNRKSKYSIYLNDIPFFYLLIGKLFTSSNFFICSRYFEYNKVLSYFISVFLSLAKKVIHVSDFNNKQWNLDNGITLWNPGKYEFLTRVKYVKGIKNVLILSRISPEKGIFESLQIIDQFDIEVRVIGGAYYDYQLKLKNSLISKYKEFKNINFFEETPNISEHLSWADSFVHAPVFEDPFPGTVLEALASNLILFTNYKGGIKEQCAGFNHVYDINDFSIYLTNEFEIDREVKYREKFSDIKDYCFKIIQIINEK